MKVLLVSNQHQNIEGVGNPIMYRMRDALIQDERLKQVDFQPAYNSVKSMLNIRKKAKEYDIVHVHFGGLYALIIWFFLLGIHTKKFVTFHGTDIHAKALKTAKSKKERLKIRLNQKASFFSIRLYERCGFVSKEMMDYVPLSLSKQMKMKSFHQPLGVNYNVFIPMDKKEAKTHLGLGNKKYILFSDVSNTNIKRRDIAETIAKEMGSDYFLLVMSGVKPSEVPYFINACDFVLLTSDEEGSPNIIREALSLNRPVFSVSIGDAAMQLDGLQNSAIISRNPSAAAEKIKKIIIRLYVDNTRDSRKNVLDFVMINRQIVDLYKNTMNL